MPKNGELRFLDLVLTREPGHVCWLYSPRSEKPLLNYSSGHSKRVKNGIAYLCLRASLVKSCSEKISETFNNEVSRLVSAGYEKHVLRRSAQKLVREVRTGFQSKRSEKGKDEKKKCVSIPYAHRIAHNNLKNVGNRYGLKVFFSAPSKLGKMCARLDRKISAYVEYAACTLRILMRFARSSNSLRCLCLESVALTRYY